MLHDFLQRFLTGWLRYHLEICLLQATDIALLNVFPHLFQDVSIMENWGIHGFLFVKAVIRRFYEFIRIYR